MALKVLCGVRDIAESAYYSIMADETTDASNIEPCNLHVLGDKMMVHKEYNGLMPVAQTNADTIVVCIKDVLLLMNLRIQDAHGQCHDGCSTMTGSKNVAAAQIKKLNEKCLLMHCYSLILLSGIQYKIFHC